MDSAAVGSTFDISNLDRLGKSEVNRNDQTQAAVQPSKIASLFVLFLLPVVANVSFYDYNIA